MNKISILTKTNQYNVGLIRKHKVLLNIKYIKFLLYVLVLLLVSNLDSANNRINFRGGSYFIFGINMGWLDGAYRHDFGYNEVYGWGPSYNSINAERYLEDLKKMGIKVIRLWVFECYEGLMFDVNGYVTNIHQSLYNNMDDFVMKCENKNLYIYFCLISYLNYGADSKAWKYLNIITNKAARSNYIKNAVIPFVTRYKDSPAFFAIDVMNEPEFVIKGNTGNWTTNGTTWTVMRSFISDCVNAIKKIDSNILVSCGSGWHNEENVAAGLYSGLGLDFYDYHKYDDTGSLIAANSLPQDVPTIIGECGQSTSKWDDSIQDSAIKSFMNNAWNNGYAGILFWRYSYPGDSEIHNFVNNNSSWRPVCYSVQEFSSYHCEAINIGDLCTNKLPEKLSKNYKFYLAQNPVKLSENLYIYIKVRDENPVKIVLYSITGDKIKTIVDNKILLPNNTYKIEWKCEDDSGNRVLPGLYVLYFKIGNYLPEFKVLGVVE